MIHGLLCYESTNLGDEIQSLAARQFLPRVDRYLPRERLDLVDGTEPVALILNGWFMREPRHWPPSSTILPLPISFHLNDYRYSRARFWQPVAAAVLLRGANREWLRRHGPIGTRDPHTALMMRARGVDAYVSGCLTLTFPAATGPRGGGIVAVDLDPALRDALQARVGTAARVAVVTHDDAVTTGTDARLARAQALLDRYATADLVVTTRLHAALPCLALGTPVLFIRSLPDIARQQPAMELAHATTRAAFLAGEDGYDVADPPPNPDRYRAFAEPLRARCLAWIAAASGQQARDGAHPPSQERGAR